MQNAIEIKNLTKQYSNGFTALDDVSFNIPKGKIFGLLGANGAGKSTLINIISSIVKKTSGTINIAGLDIDEYPQEYKYYIGIVPQEVMIDPFFNVRETLEYYAGYYGVPANQRRTDELLEVLSLGDKATLNSRRLSGGMKRRLLIAKALVHDPDIIILDEPTAGVDVELREQLWTYVEKLNKEMGKTIIITTHYLEEAEALCDDIAIINKGKVVKQDSKENLLANMGSKCVDFVLDDGSNKVITISDDSQISQAMEEITNSGRKIIDISTHETKLEDVFKQLTR